MRVETYIFPGVFQITPNIFPDNRGYFQVPYDKRAYESHGLPTNFVQDNESYSIKGTLRGLHYQKPPFAQGKLVRVVKGVVQDVIVDLRQGSPTYKKWKSFIISSSNGNILYVPPGFAHGFLALEDSIFTYKCTEFYEKNAEGGVRWNDPELNIDWQLDSEPLVSEKDKILPRLSKSLTIFDF